MSVLNSIDMLRAKFVVEEDKDPNTVFLGTMERKLLKDECKALMVAEKPKDLVEVHRAVRHKRFKKLMYVMGMRVIPVREKVYCSVGKVMEHAESQEGRLSAHDG